MGLVLGDGDVSLGDWRFVFARAKLNEVFYP
jgi:hypothetical protein